MAETVALRTQSATWWRMAAAACAAALVATLLVVSGPAPTASAYPGADEVARAKAAARKAAATVQELDAAIVELEQASNAADIAARVANEEFLEAQERNVEAQRMLFEANLRADEAESDLNAARDELALVAMAQYRNAANLGELEALMRADGFEDVISQHEALDKATADAQLVVDQVRASELVAATLRQFADEAATEAVAAEEAAEAALEEARKAAEEAQQALDETEEAREEVVVRLAELRRVAVSLERERQRGLAAARGSYSGGGYSGGSSYSGGSNPPKGGVVRGSVSKGQGAVAYAKSQLGDPYRYGASGPNAWDCSGLTQAAWRSQGVYLPRSSRSQYAYVAKVQYSELRTGDLIFWGTNRSPSRVFHVTMYVGNNTIIEAPSSGKRVKMRDYRNWYQSGLMPYAGRP